MYKHTHIHICIYVRRGPMVTRGVQGQHHVLLAPQARIPSKIHGMEPPGGGVTTKSLPGQNCILGKASVLKRVYVAPGDTP